MAGPRRRMLAGRLWRSLAGGYWRAGGSGSLRSPSLTGFALCRKAEPRLLLCEHNAAWVPPSGALLIANVDIIPSPISLCKAKNRGREVLGGKKNSGK